MIMMIEYPFLNKKVTKSSVGIAGRQLAALWPTKPMQSNFAKQFYDKTVGMHRAGFREEALQMSVYFDTQIHRYYEDKRTGSDPELEPLAVAEKNNKVLKDGITRFGEVLADKSVGFFFYLVSGTGTATVSVGQKGLSAENARSDMRTSGVMDSTGNVLLMRSQFPTGLPSATITEFGAADKAANPSVFAFRVLLEPDEYFVHEQGETWYTASHYLAFYSK